MGFSFIISVYVENGGALFFTILEETGRRGGGYFKSVGCLDSPFFVEIQSSTKKYAEALRSSGSLGGGRLLPALASQHYRCRCDHTTRLIQKMVRKCFYDERNASLHMCFSNPMAFLYFPSSPCMFGCVHTQCTTVCGISINDNRILLK